MSDLLLARIDEQRDRAPITVLRRFVDGRRVGFDLHTMAMRMLAGPHDALNPSAAAAFMISQTAVGNTVLLIERNDPGAVFDDPDGLATKIRKAVRGEWGTVLDDVRFQPRGTLDRICSGKIRRQAGRRSPVLVAERARLA